MRGQKTGFFLDQSENRVVAGVMHSGAAWIASPTPEPSPPFRGNAARR